MTQSLSASDAPVNSALHPAMFCVVLTFELTGIKTV